MHRGRWTVGLALFVVACDPMMYESFGLAPTPGTSSAAVQTAAEHADAVAAVGRVASQFGLTPGASYRPECLNTWRTSGYRHADGRKALGDILVCAIVPANGEFKIRIAETYSGRWSPKADSLRQSLTDTLARFGTIVNRTPAT